MRDLYHHIRLKHSLHDPPPLILLLGVQKGHLCRVFGVERDYAIVWDLPDKLLNRNIIPEKSRDGLRHVPGVGIVGAVKIKLDRYFGGLLDGFCASRERFERYGLARRDRIGPESAGPAPERRNLRPDHDAGSRYDASYFYQSGEARVDLADRHRRSGYRATELGVDVVVFVSRYVLESDRRHDYEIARHVLRNSILLTSNHGDTARKNGQEKATQGGLHVRLSWVRNHLENNSFSNTFTRLSPTSNQIDILTAILKRNGRLSPSRGQIKSF